MMQENKEAPNLFTETIYKLQFYCTLYTAYGTLGYSYFFCLWCQYSGVFLVLNKGYNTTIYTTESSLSHALLECSGIVKI